MTREYRLFVGIDCGSKQHQVVVVNREGKVVAERAVEHSGKAIAEFVDWLEKLCGGEPEAVAVATEAPRGAVVEMLVERKFAVCSINPKQLDRFRDRHSVAGAKDDRRDAFVLADSLRTDLALFRPVELNDAQILRLRELSRLEEELQKEHNRLSNQLWEQLHRYFPQLLQLSPGADEAWLWDLLELAPAPGQAAHLGPARIKKLLKQHRIRRWNADQVLEQLRAPALKLAPGAAEAAQEHVLLLLPRLRLVQEQRTAVGKRTATLLQQLAAPKDAPGTAGEHSDAAILLSSPGVGSVVGATMLAEASQALRERDYQLLRSYAGVAPVTKQSGKRKVVVMRYSCNGRVRNAVHHWSMNSLQKDPRSRRHYAALRAKGHSHGRALRGVADRLLAMLIAMLKRRTLYDPSRRVEA